MYYVLFLQVSGFDLKLTYIFCLIYCGINFCFYGLQSEFVA